MTQDILTPLIGQPCPVCSSETPADPKAGRLYRATDNTVCCDNCHEIFVVVGDKVQSGADVVDFKLIHVESGTGEKRTFRVPKSLEAFPDLLKAVLEAYTRLEDCSCGWTGADSIYTIFQLLHLELEKLGFEEVDIA